MAKASGYSHAKRDSKKSLTVICRQDSMPRYRQWQTSDLSKGTAMASLIVVTGAKKGDYYPLGKRSNVIGRDEALPIQVLDGEVSRKHLRIGYNQDTDTYSAVDLNSRHGVFINGAKIAGEAELADNTYITIGQTTLFFMLKDFEGRQSALSHYKKVGERSKPTLS